jgi:hypothetical protein
VYFEHQPHYDHQEDEGDHRHPEPEILCDAEVALAQEGELALDGDLPTVGDEVREALVHAHEAEAHDEGLQLSAGDDEPHEDLEHHGQGEPEHHDPPFVEADGLDHVGHRRPEEAHHLADRKVDPAGYHHEGHAYGEHPGDGYLHQHVGDVHRLDEGDLGDVGTPHEEELDQDDRDNRAQQHERDGTVLVPEEFP